MDRRDVIKSLGLVAGHALMPSLLVGFLESCSSGNDKAPYQPIFFNQEEFDWMAKVVEIIIPETTTKSAKKVNCHHFLDQVFNMCLTTDQQTLIKEGFSMLIQTLENSQDLVKKIIEIDHKAYSGEEQFAYFKMIKNYTLIAFFTSKEGATKASDYQKNPGGYKGEIPVTTTTKNQGKTSLHYYF